MLVAIFNKAVTGGARNMAARISWMLFGVAIAAWIYGGVGGMLYALEHEVTAIQSRAGTSVLDRSAHPVLYWTAFVGSVGSMAIFAAISVGCFWKALKKG
ncbi:hypothetical protein [Luteibacter aegosomatissinici]|uniref:hypothetical protein n=1 Tax=Luteibacter aegosomatissinici TaxID=2911539 RepID=UPI001FF791BE|nr:hypothetical protein [Luteibacter aegosomatissinici]UPG96595.1 hypothetical protein L2Y97_10895 [Luteibacter aegosomatissinici]